MEESASEVIKVQDEKSWHKLDERAIPLWKIQATIGLSIPFLVIFIVGTILWLFTPFPGFLLILLVIVAISLYYFNLGWLPPRSYQGWSYRLTDTIIELKSGVIIQKSVLIPLSRLQHVDLVRGPIEQRFGLSSLKIHTAGTRAASHTIPGLEAEVASKLRDELIVAAKLKTG